MGPGQIKLPRTQFGPMERRSGRFLLLLLFLLRLLEADAARAGIVWALRQLDGVGSRRGRLQQRRVRNRCRAGRVGRKRQGNQAGCSKKRTAYERFHGWSSKSDSDVTCMPQRD